MLPNVSIQSDQSRRASVHRISSWQALDHLELCHTVPESRAEKVQIRSVIYLTNVPFPITYHHQNKNDTGMANRQEASCFISIDTRNMMIYLTTSSIALITLVTICDYLHAVLNLQSEVLSVISNKETYKSYSSSHQCHRIPLVINKMVS